MDKLWKLIKLLKRGSFKASLVMLVTSLGVGGLFALIPPVREAAVFVVEKSTELTLSKKEGKMDGVEVYATRDGGDLRLQMAPCKQGEAECSLRISSSVGTLATWGITTVALGLLLFFALGLLLHNTRDPSSLIAGRRLELDLTIDRTETLFYKAKYYNIRVLDPKGGELYMPIKVNVSMDVHDGSPLGIEQFRVLSSSDNNTQENPKFKPGKLYDGKLEFSKNATRADEATIQFVVYKNFSLNRKAFRERWNTQEFTDDFKWIANTYWDEVVIRFIWEAPPHLESVPWVKTRRVIGAIEEDVADNEWDIRTWTLQTKNVTPGREFIFRWKLAEHDITPVASDPALKKATA